ncbi:hypothetical protein MIDIC_140021 [Alphaproteobacteria bacterium]
MVIHTMRIITSAMRTAYLPHANWISLMLVDYTTITNTLAGLPLSFITCEIRIECANNGKHKVIQNLQNEIEKPGLCYINAPHVPSTPAKI